MQQLHTDGLLPGSFRPDEDMCAVRAYIRHRDPLIRYRSAHVQHMPKALHLLHVQLTNVISDITGVTGLQIIRAMVQGERDSHMLAAYRNAPCAQSEEDMSNAFTGHYRPEHLFALKQALALHDFFPTNGSPPVTRRSRRSTRPSHPRSSSRTPPARHASADATNPRGLNPPSICAAPSSRWPVWI